MEQEEKSLGIFEKYLTLWIAICIVLGLLVGRFVPQFGQFMDSLKFRSLSIPIGILLFFMMYPTVLGIRFGDIRQASRRPKPPACHNIRLLGCGAAIDDSLSEPHSD